MQRVIIEIPDNKLSFFMELVKNLGFKANNGKSEDFELSEEHKSILDQRLENYKNNPDSYLKWEDVQEDIDKIL